VVIEHIRWIPTLSGGGLPSSIMTLPEMNTGIWIAGADG
jgi:hypothetical protein